MDEQPQGDAVAGVARETDLDPAMVQIAMQRFQSEQNLAAGVVAGLVAALVGAAVWAMVTVATGYQIGWMAVGIGFLVGIAVRKVGKGLDKSFGIAGALLALLGCLVGNFLTVVNALAEVWEVGYFEALSRIDPASVPELMGITFSPIDLLFYGIALYEGYKLSFRRITVEELETAVKGSPAIG